MTLRQISTVACWLAILASFTLSFQTWFDLAVLAGFGALAVAMPFCVDGYVVTALTTWLTPEVSKKLARFAQSNLYVIGLIGMATQASYHAYLAAHPTAPGDTTSDGEVALAFAVGLLPMAVATLAVHIKARTVRELDASAIQQPEQASQTAAATASVSPAPLAQALPPLHRPLSAPLQPPSPSATTVQESSADDALTAATEPAAVPPAADPKPVAAPAARKPRPHKVEESGSGPLPNGTDLSDIRRWVDVDGLSHKQVADRLGVSPRTATRRIAEARAAAPRLVALP